jgi:hypothetical protein
MQYVMLASVVAGFSVVLGGVWLRRRREAPLRREIRAQDVTFRAGVAVWLKESYGWGGWLDLKSGMALVVRGDAIEISSVAWPFRIVMGEEYYFRARETTIQVRREPSRPFELRWIVVTGRTDGKDVRLAISTRNAHQLSQVWNALAGAGAVPVGPPPPGRDGTGRDAGRQGWITDRITVVSAVLEVSAVRWSGTMLM